MITSSKRRFGSLPLLLFAGACAATPAVKPPPAAPISARSPTISGQEGVLGRDARTLVGQLGEPDLDIREGTARKLQFAGPACILDAYLYPPQSRSEPIVTYIDARLPDGRDIDRASCVAALQAQRAR